MATRAEMDHLASKLSTLETFSWLVRGLPVVALMQEEAPRVAETLGQPLDKNGAGQVLRLEETTISEEDADRETEEKKAAPMTERLTEAWKYCPDAYRLFNAELSWFGSALACGTNVRVIADCHLSCTLALIRHCTRIAIATSPGATGLTDKSLVRDADLATLVTWLCELHPGAKHEVVFCSAGFITTRAKGVSYVS